MTQISEQDLKTAMKKVSTAKIAVITTPAFIFYGSILAKLKFIYDDAIKTAAVDGIHMILSPTFVNTLTHRQTVFLVMHELKHLVYQHIDRLNGRDPKLWNIAGDYVINNYLDTKKFDVIPGALLDHQYDGMSTDEVYFKLLQQQKNDPSSIPEPDHNDLLPPNAYGNGGNNPVDNLAKAKEFMDQAIAEAMVKTETAIRGGNKDAAANIPGDVARYYENLVNPTVPWQQVLQRFLFGVAKTEYSYRRLSRRSHSLDIPLPGLHGQSMDYIDFAIDTSGSVSEADFNKFISEIHEVFKTFSPQNIGIMQFDDIIQDTQKVCSLDEFSQIKFKGGGGTTIGPVLEAFKNNDAKALVILTDGYFGHNKNQDPQKPVIWAIYDNLQFTPEFGSVVHFTLE